jgi:hypothetical protein
MDFLVPLSLLGQQQTSNYMAVLLSGNRTLKAKRAAPAREPPASSDHAYGFGLIARVALVLELLHHLREIVARRRLHAWSHKLTLPLILIAALSSTIALNVGVRPV